MAIGTRTAAQVNADLRNTDTTELRFRNAIMETVDQVDANQIDLAATRNISLTGDVVGTAQYDLRNDTARDISMMTTIQGMSVSGTDISDNTITAQQIANNTITNTQIATNTITQDRIDSSDKVRIRILASDGTVLRQFDGLSIS